MQVAARISSMMPAATIGNNAIELSMSWQRSKCATSPTTTIDRRGTPPDGFAVAYEVSLARSDVPRARRGL